MTKITSGKELLAQKPKTGKGSEIDQEQIPTSDELSEIHTPDLSTDTFQIADKTFKIKFSNIKTQKMMAKSLESINDLISKINVTAIVKGFRDRMRESDKKTSEQISKLADLDKDKLEEEVILLTDQLNEGDDFYIDIVDTIKDIIHYGGVHNIIIALMDLMTGIVFAICHSQDNTITQEWIEDNIDFNQAQNVFFRQMEKDEIQGKVIDFLAVLIRLVTQK